MGALDVILGRDAQGNVSKSQIAMIAMLLWWMYQRSGANKGGGGAEPVPAPAPGRMPAPRRQPQESPAPESGTATAQRPGGELGDLLDSVRMPRGRCAEDGGSGGGTLGDILSDIFGDPNARGGGRAPRGPRGPGGPDGGPMNMPGGSLGEILGEILGGGRGAPRAAAGAPTGRGGDSLGAILGRAGGGALSGALGDIIKQFEQAGQGEAAKSWVARGDNIPVTPRDIEHTFGADVIGSLAAQIGMNKDELLKGLSKVMPETIDKLTPGGKLPSAEELARL